MTCDVMVVVSGPRYEARIHVERRSESGEFVRDEHVEKVRGREDGPGFVRVYLPHNAQIVITEHYIPDSET